MPLQNRVTPLGELVADPARGLVYGNRGCLHDESGRIRRRYNGSAGTISLPMHFRCSRRSAPARSCLRRRRDGPGASCSRGCYREALELAEETLAQAHAASDAGIDVQLLERLVGYTLVQARRPTEGRPHFDESLRLAREGGFQFELALTLRALAQTGMPALGAEADQILARLGVVATPHVPLP